MKISHESQNNTIQEDLGGEGGEGQIKKAHKLKLTPCELIIVLENISALLEQDYPLQEALIIIGQEVKNRKLKYALNDMARAMQMGRSFVSTLSQYPGFAPSLIVYALHAAETAGTLPVTFKKIILVLKDGLRNKKQKDKIIFNCPIHKWGELYRNFHLIEIANNLGLLLTSTLTVSQAVTTLVHTATKKERIIFEGLAEQLEKGASLHGALQLFPETFPPLFVSLVAQGERRGSLQEVLEKATKIYELNCTSYLE